jgi:ribosomal protein S18 acetylase RimI-like enzyme
MRTEVSPAFHLDLLSRIEDAGLNASAPPQQRWLDGWLMRLCPGKAKRARCINAVAAGRLPARDKLAIAEAVFAEASLPLILRITPFTLPTGLDALLESLGLHRFDDTRVMVRGDLSTFTAPALPAGTTLQAIGLEAFAQRVGAMRGSPIAQRQAHAQRLANSPVPFSAFELKREGEVLACGQIAVEGELVGLYDIFTAAEARGQGLATIVCTHLLIAARVAGARHAYLQVDGDNHPARAVYHRLGFADGYAYHYRARDPAAA